MVNPTVFVLVAYYMTDQPTDDYRPVLVWLVCVLIVFTAHAYGLVFGAAMGMQVSILSIEKFSLVEIYEFILIYNFFTACCIFCPIINYPTCIIFGIFPSYTRHSSSLTVDLICF